MKQRVIYYENEATDDFAGTDIDTKPLREDYEYLPSGWLYKVLAFLVYRVIAQPLVFLFTKLVFLQRFENRQVLKAAKGRGAYLYGNHTNTMADAYIPNIHRYEKRNYIIAGPDAMSIRGLNSLLTMLGCIPLGNTLRQQRELRNCVLTRVAQGNLVTIYPEAHIWPYYTRIRPFPAASFHYPATDGAPVYAFTNCYQKRRLGKLPKIVTYVDGPFYADMDLPMPQRKQTLRDACYEAMCRRAAEYSTYEYVRYEEK